MQPQVCWPQVHFNHNPEPRIITNEINRMVLLGEVVFYPYVNLCHPSLFLFFTICLCLSCVTVIFKYLRTFLGTCCSHSGKLFPSPAWQPPLLVLKIVQSPPPPIHILPGKKVSLPSSLLFPSFFAFLPPSDISGVYFVADTTTEALKCT